MACTYVLFLRRIGGWIGRPAERYEVSILGVVQRANAMQGQKRHFMSKYMYYLQKSDYRELKPYSNKVSLFGILL
jgi:hypothetical protein